MATQSPHSQVTKRLEAGEGRVLQPRDVVVVEQPGKEGKERMVTRDGNYNMNNNDNLK